MKIDRFDLPEVSLIAQREEAAKRELLNGVHVEIVGSTEKLDAVYAELNKLLRGWRELKSIVDAEANVRSRYSSILNLSTELLTACEELKAQNLMELGDGAFRSFRLETDELERFGEIVRQRHETLRLRDPEIAAAKLLHTKQDPTWAEIEDAYADALSRSNHVSTFQLQLDRRENLCFDLAVFWFKYFPQSQRLKPVSWRGREQSYRGDLYQFVLAVLKFEEASVGGHFKSAIGKILVSVWEQAKEKAQTEIAREILKQEAKK